MHVSSSVSNLAVGVIAAIHFVISMFEMFIPKRLLAGDHFRFTEAEATKAGPIVANAGLYNGFVAAGLALSLTADGNYFVYFFLVCVVVAGVFGAVTLKAPKTLALQTAPALIAVVLVWMTGR